MLFLLLLFCYLPDCARLYKDYRNPLDYNENFNKDWLDIQNKEDEVVLKEDANPEYEYFQDPKTAAMIDVEVLESEEKKGPSLGRVLGPSEKYESCQK